MSIQDYQDYQNFKARLDLRLYRAQKEHDVSAVNALRDFKTVIAIFEKNFTSDNERALSVDTQAILKRLIKQRRGMVELLKSPIDDQGNAVTYTPEQQATVAGRIENEEKEIAVLSEFLPIEVSREEITNAAMDAIKNTIGKQFGPIMGKAMKTLKATGKDVDGEQVKKILQSLIELSENFKES